MKVLSLVALLLDAVVIISCSMGKKVSLVVGEEHATTATKNKLVSKEPLKNSFIWQKGLCGYFGCGTKYRFSSRGMNWECISLKVDGVRV